jgi:hypothetical protein
LTEEIVPIFINEKSFGATMPPKSRTFEEDQKCGIVS